MNKTNKIKIEDCIDRHIYSLSSRNLSFGVFNKEDNNGFIGIRLKFGSEFLFTEYHYDNGPPYGTACPLEDTGITVPVDIELSDWDNVKLFEFLDGIRQVNIGE